MNDEPQLDGMPERAVLQRTRYVFERSVLVDPQGVDDVGDTLFVGDLEFVVERVTHTVDKDGFDVYAVTAKEPEDG